MSGLLILSIILIKLALTFYSLGVWAERISRYLKVWHVLSFWTGFVFDISGTFAMHLLAEGPFDMHEPHTLSGQISLWLMFAHVLWATRVVYKGSDTSRKKFHLYSLVVWLIWLIPYFGGMYISIKM